MAGPQRRPSRAIMLRLSARLAIPGRSGAFCAKTLSFFGLPAPAPLTLAISALCSGSTRPWIETRFPGLPLVCVSQSPQLPKARRFGAKRDSLFTLDSERRCRLEAQCLFPISAFPIRSSPQLRLPATRPPPPSRNRRSPTFWRAATFSASPRPAPARPPLSSCPCSRFWKRAAPGHECPAP